MATSWYRRYLFNYKGNREYTRLGYEAAATRFVEEDLDVDCSDRHYMITGSNSGIGLETALEIAKRGGIIHMVCRNKTSATQARSTIITTTGNDKIYLHIVDLGRPREVIAWAHKFAAQQEKLHVLVHNAGCMVHQRNIDEDGVEFNFAVNTLTVHILTLTFMPLLQRSEDARVVAVSSAGLLTVRLDPHDLMHSQMDPFNGRLAYSQHKRQQVVMMLWYAQHYNNVHFSSMHPGWADTNAVRTSIPEFYEMMKDNLRTPAQGADTVVWLAVSRAAIKHPGGLFFQDREPVATHFPLAWTKSSIEEEDFLLTNIQKVYNDIYSKMYNPDGSTKAPTHTEEQQKPQEEEEEEEERKDSPVEKVTKGKEEFNNTDASTNAFPLLPPPPPPATKVTNDETSNETETKLEDLKLREENLASKSGSENETGIQNQDNETELRNETGETKQKQEDFAETLKNENETKLEDVKQEDIETETAKLEEMKLKEENVDETLKNETKLDETKEEN